MTLAELMECPTILDQGPGMPRYHESLFRAYQVLQKARAWLILDTPPAVVLEMIDLCMDAPGKEKQP